MNKNLFGVALTLVTTLSSAQSTVQLIRSATVIITYKGQKILVDPMLSEKGAFQSFAGIEKNPTIDLKIPIDQITNSLDLVLVTHCHPDHFDQAASDLLDKSITLFHQPADTTYFKKEQFKNATAIVDKTVWNGIEIIRVEAQHGTGDVLKYTGQASGYILRSKGQATIYIVGDGVWTDEVKKNIQTYRPDYIIVNSGGATLPGFKSGLIIMDDEQTITLIKESGKAKIIAVHLEALDHCRVTRSLLKTKAELSNVERSRLIIPQDGEIIQLFRK